MKEREITYSTERDITKDSSLVAFNFVMKTHDERKNRGKGGYIEELGRARAPTHFLIFFKYVTNKILTTISLEL